MRPSTMANIFDRCREALVLDSRKAAGELMTI
jgi:hypothetical protein